MSQKMDKALFPSFRKLRQIVRTQKTVSFLLRKRFFYQLVAVLSKNKSRSSSPRLMAGNQLDVPPNHGCV